MTDSKRSGPMRGLWAAALFALIAAGLMGLLQPAGQVSAQAAIGGQSFTLQSNATAANPTSTSVTLTWNGGTTQASYALVRSTTTGTTVIAVPGGAGAVTINDTAATPITCYQLRALNASGGTIGSSDFECIILTTFSAPILPIAAGAVPPNTRIALNQTASLSVAWGPAPGAADYIVWSLFTDGVVTTSGLSANLPGSLGSIVCAVVLPRDATGKFIGASDIFCGVPGMSTLGPTIVTATPALTNTSTVTQTPVNTVTSTQTPVPAISNTPTRTNTPVIVGPSLTPTPTADICAVLPFLCPASPTPTVTAVVNTNTPTVTVTPAITSTPSNTATPIFSSTVTQTRTSTATNTPVNTSTPIPTAGPAGLTISKTHSFNQNNNQVVYTITVTNTNFANATGVVVSDTLPAGETFVSAGDVSGTNFNCGAVGNLVTCVAGNVPGTSTSGNPAGGTATIQISAVVSAPCVSPLFNAAQLNPQGYPAGVGGTPTPGPFSTPDRLDAAPPCFTASPTLSSTATRTATPTITTTPANTLSPTISPTPNVDLTISKFAQPNPVTGGQQLTYTLLINNVGSGPATGVTVVDYLESGGINFGAPGSNFTCGGTGPQFGAGVCNPTDPNTANLVFYQSAQGNSGSNFSCNYPDPTFGFNPLNAVTCTGGVIGAGGGASITIVVQTQLNCVEILNVAQVNPDNAIPEQRFNNNYAATLTSCSANGSPTVTVSPLVTFTPSVTPTITNTPVVTATAIPTTGGILFSKNGNPGAVKAGDVLTYQVQLTNNTGSTISPMGIRDTIPGNLLFITVSSSATGSSTPPVCGQNAGTVDCGNGTLFSGDTATVTIVTQVASCPPGTTFTNTANLTNPNAVNNTATTTTTCVAATPSSTATITQTPAPTSTITLTPTQTQTPVVIVVTATPAVDLAVSAKTNSVVNTSTGAASTSQDITFTSNSTVNSAGATVTDTLPAGFSITAVSFLAGTGSCSGGGTNVLSCTITGTFNGSNPVTIRVFYSVPTTTPSGDLVDTATITAPAGQADTNPANNSKQGVTTVYGYNIAVAVSGPSVVIAQPTCCEITYTITLTNFSLGGQTSQPFFVNGSLALRDPANTPGAIPGSVLPYASIDNITTSRVGDSCSFTQVAAFGIYQYTCSIQPLAAGGPGVQIFVTVDAITAEPDGGFDVGIDANAMNRVRPLGANTLVGTCSIAANTSGGTNPVCAAEKQPTTLTSNPPSAITSNNRAIFTTNVN